MLKSLEDSFPTKEDLLLTFGFVLKIRGSLLSSKAKAKKPLMEDCLDELDNLEKETWIEYCLNELDNLEALEYMCTT